MIVVERNPNTATSALPILSGYIHMETKVSMSWIWRMASWESLAEIQLDL